MTLTRKHFGAALCALLAALTLLASPARAAASIDVDRTGSLSIRYAHDGAPVSGARFDLWRVADVDADGAFTLSGDFAGCPVQLTGLSGGSWRALAETLAAYAARGAFAPLLSGETDADGTLRFAPLRTGLYLVTGQPFSDGQYVYTAEPFLVSLPSPDGDGWRYALDASPKHTRDDAQPDDGSTVTRRVLKRWDDGGDASLRPDAITVYLLRDGALCDTVTLSAANGWRWHWDALPKYGDTGLPIDWQVAEEPVSGYTVSLLRESVTFVITNTRTAAPDTPDSPASPDAPDTPDTPDSGGSPDGGRLPQTGQLWWPVSLLAALGLASLLCGALLRRRERADA